MKTLLRLLILIAALLALAPALALSSESAPARSGKAVYGEVCSKCHATGAQGAPRVGDKNAWRPRASRGMSKLTQSALKGLRNMPPHGARFDLTDLELKRAIVYMINQSGGHWTEPADTSQVGHRTGREIVEGRCQNCHEQGKGGAPRIGDRSAWIPRLSRGF